MYLCVLNLSWKTAKPEAKIVLMKLLQKYAVGEPILIGLNALCTELGVSDKVLSNSLSSLIRLGYLEQIPTPRKRTLGRPRHDYQLTEALEDALLDQQSIQPPGHSKKQIDELLLPDKKGGNKEKAHPLQLAHRLVLSTLLINSDSRGVVTALSKSGLRGLTGMSMDRLNSQIATLKKHVYIRSSVSGTIGQHLLGAAKTIYFLNLKHEKYGSTAVPSVTFLCWGAPHQVGLLDEARVILGLSEKLKIAQKNSSNDVVLCIKYFRHFIPVTSDAKSYVALLSELSLPSVQVYFQAKLEEYASFLLTHHWVSVLKKQEGDLLGAEPADEDCIAPELMEKIEAELLHPLRLKNHASEDNGGRYFKAKRSLTRLVFDIALVKAIRIKEALIEHESDVPLENMRYVILALNPRRKIPPYFAVDCTSKDGSLLRSKIITLDLSAVTHGCLGPQVESEISDKDRLKYGLISETAAKFLSSKA